MSEKTLERKDNHIRLTRKRKVETGQPKKIKSGLCTAMFVTGSQSLEEL